MACFRVGFFPVFVFPNQFQSEAKIIWFDDVACDVDMNIQWNSEKKSSAEKIYYAKHVIYLIYLKFVYNLKTKNFI